MLLVGPQACAHFLPLWACAGDAAGLPRLQVLALCEDATPWQDAAQASREHAQRRQALDAQLQGLLPGVHRLVFDGGAVTLTLALGPLLPALRSQDLAFDALVLDAPIPVEAQQAWAKALVRLSRPGTRLVCQTASPAWADALAQAGFLAEPHPPSPGAQGLQAVFHPRWQPRRRTGHPHRLAHTPPGSCLVIGAGLAGAACASSLARRGWQVTVIDRHGPAAGASGLPAGLMAPHVSSDDSPLSRLSRAGVRATWLECQRLLRQGQDWAPTGVLQRRLEAGATLPPDWPPAGAQWSCDARQAGHLPAALQADAIWHARGAWIKPAQLVRAWLAEPGIGLLAPAAVQRLARNEQGRWRVLDADGQTLAEADLVVLAAAHGSQALIEALDPGAIGPGLQAIRGQVSWALQAPSEPMPPVPVNGHGSLLPGVPLEGGPAWVLGASFDRDDSDPSVRARDHGVTLAKLQRLLPETAASLAARLAAGQVQAWAAVRCAWRDHLPVVGPLSPQLPGLWLCTAFGSRGLSYSALCAELIAAWLHGEPLPLDPRLAQQLHASRLLTAR